MNKEEKRAARCVCLKILYANINRIKKTFKWKPRTPIKTGLRKTILSYEKSISK